MTAEDLADAMMAMPPDKLAREGRITKRTTVARYGNGPTGRQVVAITHSSGCVRFKITKQRRK